MSTDVFTRMNQTSDIEASMETATVRIPNTLKEFGELPSGYVPVCVDIELKNLDHVGAVGLRVEDNRMCVVNPALERIFFDEGQKLNIGHNRTKCVFAYPVKPDQVRYGLRFDPSKIRLEVMIDPTGVLVADGELYTESKIKLRKGEQTRAIEIAGKYWSESMPLKDYLREREKEDFVDYSFPEALIPQNIHPDHIRIYNQP